MFLHTFAANLNQQVQEREIRGLLLIAPAKALGILRKGLSDATRNILSGELVRDYVKMPLHEIERHLTNLQ